MVNDSGNQVGDPRTVLGHRFEYFKDFFVASRLPKDFWFVFIFKQCGYAHLHRVKILIILDTKVLIIRRVTAEKIDF